jgi:effector-binding domain-containing protein
MELPELTVAAVTHISRPDMNTPVSIDLGSWIEENGYQINPEMPGREVYLSPQEGNKLRYVTESQMPILGAGFMQ